MDRGGHLVLQGCHPFLQMELQPLVGLRQQFVHGVREALVVFIVHPFPLPRLRGTQEDDSERRIFKSQGRGGGRREVNTTSSERFIIWMCTVK